MDKKIQNYINELKHGNKLSLARCITLVENSLGGSEVILRSLVNYKNAPIIGVTGPPGA